MTAAIALSSTSSIAIERFIAQPRRSAEIIAFPCRAPEPVAEVEAEPSVVDIEAVAEIQPFIATGPATALIERKPLTRAVEIAIEAVEKRNSIPILSHVSLEASAGGITIHGTDESMEIAVFVPAAVDDHFGTTLPAHLMKDLLKKAASSDFVSISASSEGVAKLDFERVDYTLQTLSSADFPKIEMGEIKNQFEMSGPNFFSMIDGTIDAISTEESRYYLNGVYLHVLDNGNRRTIAAAATDGHRLYSQSFELPFGADDLAGSIIPTKMVKTLHKLLKGKSRPETVSIAVSDAKIRVSFDNVVITSRLVDGTFPDYKRVIPAYNSKPAQFKASALIEAAESVSLISNERSRAVKMSFDGDHSFCLLEVNNPDSGRAEMSAACQYNGYPLEIGFNSRYLIEALKDATMIGGDDVTITFEDAGSPAIITSGREDWLAVIMPMRV